MKSMQSKVAAITGAGSGIGRSLAIQLAKEGCHLALSDINEQALAETQKLLSMSNAKVSADVLDVANEAAVFAWAQKVDNEHGKINLIFNNAGVALSGTVIDLEIKDIQWIMDINFWGVIYGTKAFLPYLERSGDGHIINISSVFGLSSQPMMSAYNASKFAVRGFTESLRQDLEFTGSKVSATCVHPGGIRTGIAKAARVAGSLAESSGVSREKLICEFEKSFINTPESAARAIIKAVKKNKRRVLVGPDAKVYDMMVRLFPAAYQRLFTAVVKWRMKVLESD